MYRLFIVDDHPIMRRGYAYLTQSEPDLVVCGGASNGLDALQQIRALHPDLVICDLSLGPGMHGLELIKTLQAEDPDLPIVVVSMHDETLYADRALKAGARGYVMKSEADTALIQALRRVLNGHLYLSPHAIDQMLGHVARHGDAVCSSVLASLSDRELEVFGHLGHGRTTQEIAASMLISPKTVESYRTRIKEKLGVKHNVSLIRRAVQWVEQEA
ncbi:MAG: response regulator transcription factor [Bacteroidota bacterium]